MRINGMKESAGSQTAWITGATIGIAVAIDNVVSGVTWVRLIINSKLCVIQKVERFDAELQRTPFCQRNTLGKLNIEIGPVRIA